MTNSITTITRERLEEVVLHIHVAGGMRLPEIQEMARALLAVMDAKPVAFTFSDEFSDLNASGIGVCRIWSEECYPDAPVRLYTTPPAPSAPDGYCLVKKSDVLTVLRPSETSSHGFSIPIDNCLWKSGERMFKAAAPDEA